LTDAEVLQELLHRYLALRLWPQGREIFLRFSNVMQDRVEAIQAIDVQRAASLADKYQELVARDLLHVAVMQRLGIHRIISADTGFDRLPEFERLDPAKLSGWRRSILS
jgi:predicted nucleic acid-binding protein